MIKEYKTIKEIASPLMIVDGVENVTYDELGELELPNGQVRRCKVLEVEGSRDESTLPRPSSAARCFGRYARPCLQRHGQPD